MRCSPWARETDALFPIEPKTSRIGPARRHRIANAHELSLVDRRSRTLVRKDRSNPAHRSGLNRSPGGDRRDLAGEVFLPKDARVIELPRLATYG